MEIKRILTGVLALVLIFSCSGISFAEEQSAVCLVHKSSGRVIVSENADKPLPAAGLTHLAALLVISESVADGEFDLSRQICVSNAASAVPGQTAFIEANETIPAEDLYKSAAMICAGDAIYALAETLSGSAERFIERVNERLSALGISAKYADILGQGMEICAADIAKISCALADCPSYTSYSSIYMDSITHTSGRVTELVNQNRLIRNMQGCRGLATSSSASAGYCGSIYTERNGCGYVCVILGAKNSKDRFERASGETEAAYTAYRETAVAAKGEAVIADYPVAGACVNSCSIVAANTLYVLTENGSKVNTEYNLPEKLAAPISVGDCIGNIVCTSDDGSILGTVELTVKADIPKANFLDFIALVSKALING